MFPVDYLNKQRNNTKLFKYGITEGILTYTKIMVVHFRSQSVKTAVKPINEQLKLDNR